LEVPLSDKPVHAYATDYVLQRYHLSDLDEAQRVLTATQYEGLLREIAEVEQKLTAQAQPRPPVRPSGGISTPVGLVTPVTGLLLLALWIVFGLETLRGGSDNLNVLYAMGAVTGDTLSSGQYWRLVASCFLHIGIVHIVSNSLGLIWLCTLAERLFGPLRYLSLYLATGVVGAVAAAMTSSPNEVTVGASGAIMGMAGALLVGSWRNRGVIDPSWGSRLSRSLLVIIAINLAFGFSVSGISNAGHIGGALSGGVLALLIPFRSTRYSRLYSRVADVVSIILILAVIMLATTYVWTP
jgi:rhomboid protease GluP